MRKKTITILPIFIAIAIVGYLFKEELRLVENKSVEYRYNKKYQLMSFYDFDSNKKECQCFYPIIEFALKNKIKIPVEVLITDDFIIKNPQTVNKLMNQNLLEYTEMMNMPYPEEFMNGEILKYVRVLSPINEDFILKMISLYSSDTPIGGYYRIWNEMVSQKYSNNKEILKLKIPEYDTTMIEMMILRYSSMGGDPIHVSKFLEHYKIELNEQIISNIIFELKDQLDFVDIEDTRYLYHQISKKFKKPNDDMYIMILSYGSEELKVQFLKNNKTTSKKIGQIFLESTQVDDEGKNLIRNLKILTKMGYNLAPIKKDIMLYAIENNMLNVLFYAYEFIDKKQNDNMEIVKLMKMTKEFN